jgi:hypothetical protein
LRAAVQMPRPDSQIVGRVRLRMMGRGFDFVPTPAVLDDVLLREVRTGRMVLYVDSGRWWKFPRLAGYGCWLERLLDAALPEEQLRLRELELRHEPAGSEDEKIDRLHADGSYLRSVCTLYGPTTIYRDGGKELSVPSGHTLLMTAMDRARAMRLRCTLHRRPGLGPERAVIVCSFEPRAEQPRMSDASSGSDDHRRRVSWA